MYHTSKTPADQEWEGPQPPVPPRSVYARETLFRESFRLEPPSDFVVKNHDSRTAFQYHCHYAHAAPEDIDLVPEELSCPPRRPVPFRSLTDLERGGHEPLSLEKVAQPRVRLPLKKYARWCRHARWSIFNIYGRLYVLVFLANLVAMICRTRQPGIFDRPATLSTPVSVNLMIAVLIRQEHLLNFLYWSLGRTPKWFPLRLRRIIAKLYHLGGIHSGCAVSAMLWFILFNVAVERLIRHGEYDSIKIGVFVVTVIIDILLANILILSLPNFRAQYHNIWEQVHRFGGWLVVALFWIHMFLFSAITARQDPAKSLARVVVQNPTLYCLIIITVALLVPWLSLRKVPVRAEPLSDHAIRLHFTHQNLDVCTSPRFTDHPMKEWHAFAAAPATKGIGYSIVVSNAGDWTRRLIKNPPTELWTKGTPTRGALYMAQIFRRVLLVATGSGIAPILGLISIKNIEYRILWSTPDPENVFPHITDVLKDTDPNAIIWDTHKLGRPRLVEEAYRLYRSSGAESVWIISNAAVTKKVVYGLESRGVPTFAPIFDS
ncbi:hypothetical protein H2200_009403 [Cladophialophora chaetospira]|uniref:Integral membrane protein TmpA n=1 Tax=Cladophialophora chaetospira TaxID=386627 RepID=A0AA39CFP4_9EURO|nr:hypothetical protein H2200_009403 [Cladophialophora chaetospira]